MYGIVNSSVILTEDTDSFIIGERVWVSGKKSGHIAYIGETQFAPGEWAGIALDEPIGKNDGSVGGIRYFQCEPKKGVFCRLTRLTRQPLNQDDTCSRDSHIPSPVSPLGSGMRGSPVSPAHSSTLTRMSASMRDSNNSLASNTSHQIDYKVGDRVIIKSSQGSKVGTVRFIGTTEFASGEWVGVELDDPRGKNDGSVNGVRYFECRMNFGLFAPISKVCKSPLKTRPGNCQIHSSSGILPPTGILRRTGSRESMSNASVTSSSGLSQQGRRVRLGIAALTTHHDTAKDLLKEKQQHIEQLLKERELERSEIAKCASQVEDAEKKFVTVKSEFEKYILLLSFRQYRAETETKLQECMNIMNELKQTKCELQNQLEDEKRKNEDLLFRLEEISITKDETDVLNRNHLSKINELEDRLKRAKEEAEDEINKKSQIDEVSSEAKQEVGALKKLPDDSNTTTLLIESLQREVDKYKADLLERNSMIMVLEQELSKATAEITKQDTEKHEDAETALEKQIEQLKIELSAKTYDLEISGNSVQMKDSEIAQLKSDLSSIKVQLEQTTAALKSKEESFVELQNELKSCKENFDKTLNEMKAYQDSLSADVSKLKTENDELSSNLKSQSEQFDKTRNELSEKLAKSVEENVCKEQELIVVKNDLTNIIEEKDKALREVTTKYEQEMENITTRLKQLQVDLNEKNRTLIEMQKLQDNTSKEMSQKTEAIEQLGFAVTRLEEQNKQMLNEKADFVKNIEQFDDRINVLNTQLEDSKQQLHTLTEKLEAAKQECDEYKNALKEKEKEADGLKFELQSAKENLEAANNDLTKYQTNFNDAETTLNREKEELRSTLHNERLEFEKYTKDLHQKIEETEKMISEKTVEVTDRNQKLEAVKQECNEYKTALKEKEKEVDDFKFQLQTVKESLEAAKHDLTKYQANFSDAEVTLNREKEELRATLQNERLEFEKCRKDFQQKIEEAEKIISEKTVEVTDRNQKLEAVKEECNEYKTALKEKEKVVDDFKFQLQTVKESLEAAKHDLTKYQANFSDAEVTLNREKEELRATLQNERLEFEKCRKDFQQKMEEAEKIISEKTVEVTDKDQKLEAATHVGDEYKTALKEKEKEVDNLKLELQSVKESLEAAHNDITKYQTKFSNAEITLNREKEELRATLQNERLEFEKYRKDFQQKMEEAEKMTLEKTAEVTDRDQKLEAAIHVGDEYKTALNEKEREIGDLKFQLQTLKESFEAAKHDLAEYQANFSDAEVKLNREKEELTDRLQNERIEFEKYRKGLQQKMEETEKMLLERTVEVTDKKQKLENLEGILREIQSGNEKALNLGKEKYQKDMEDSQTKISNLLAELESKNIKINDIETRLEEARSKAKEKIKEFEMLKTKLKSVIDRSEVDTENDSKLKENVTKLKCINEEVKKHIEETLIHYVALDLGQGDLAESLRLKIEDLLNATEKIESLYRENIEKIDNDVKIKADLESTKQKLVTAENEFKLYKSSLNDVNKEKEDNIASLERQNSEVQSCNNEILGKLGDKQSDERADYEQKLQTLEKTIQELSQVNKELEKQKTDVEIRLKSSVESESQLKQIIASNTADNTIEKLRKELKDANEKLAEKEKQMNEGIGFLKLEVRKAHIKDIKPYDQLFEEKMFAESQVKFLNSIIVDMQEKNEKQKARIEILEQGYSSSAADELVALGFKSDYNKQPAPRMYCDICEEFDLHETEDCSLQTDYPIITRNADKPKEVPAPRPYCDNCEGW
nr:unnamed protein product [Callosobruchus analis]